MSFSQTLSPEQKAQQINFDDRIYGSFAEIGAGQEVSRFFFRAGGASGTVAKTISAYDKCLSDVYYGKEGEKGRYVCQSRLEKMLSIEFEELEQVLRPKRGGSACFFSFASTISATPYGHDRPGSGWIGVKFQEHQNQRLGQVVLHITLKDRQNIDQQNATGTLGVNLLHACFHYYENVERFVDSLMDSLTKQRVEINMIHIEGDALNADPRLYQLELVKKGLTKGIMFSPSGDSWQPGDALYKKNLLVLRGSFRPPTKRHKNMLDEGLKSFCKAKELDPEKVILLPEISMNNLLTKGEVDTKDFLSRIDMLGALGHQTLISNTNWLFELNQYLSTLNCGHVHYVIGTYGLDEILDLRAYHKAGVSAFEGIGRLFGPKVSVSVYPSESKKGDELITLSDMTWPGQFHEVVKVLKALGHLYEVSNIPEDIGLIWSSKVAKDVSKGVKGWEKDVPDEVAEFIKENDLFS